MSGQDVFKTCPVENSLKFLGKKWTFNILRDLFFGPQKFSNFLETNNGLTTKVLAQRLRDMEEVGLITKIENGNHKGRIYEITGQGRQVGNILTGLADYSINNYPEVVLSDIHEPQRAKEVVRQTFK